MKTVAFTGMPWSGKSEAVKIAKQMNIPVVRMGDSVWDEVKNRNLKVNKKNVGRIADEMRKTNGRDIWARRTLEKIKKMKGSDSVVIDGIRNVEEIDFFKNKLGGEFTLVAIDSPDEIRHQRALAREREDDSKDIDEIKKRDKRELGWGLGTVIASADIVISNDGALEEFRKKVIKVLNNLNMV